MYKDHSPNMKIIPMLLGLFNNVDVRMSNPPQVRALLEDLTQVL